MMRGVFVAVSVAVIGFLSGTAWSQYTGALGAVGARSTALLQTSQTAIGQDFKYPQQSPEITVLLVEVAPGGETGRHLHPVPEVAYVLEGTITVAVDGHGEKAYGPGQSFVEAINTWHNGVNRGKKPVRILAVFVGERGKPNVVRP